VGQLTFERIFSDKDFEVYQIGLWEFTRTSDGKAFWEFTGQPGAVSRSDQGGEVTERVREALPRRVLRREDLSCVPSAKGTAPSHSWDALLEPDKAS